MQLPDGRKNSRRTVLRPESIKVWDPYRAKLAGRTGGRTGVGAGWAPPPTQRKGGVQGGVVGLTDNAAIRCPSRGFGGAAAEHAAAGSAERRSRSPHRGSDHVDADGCQAVW